MWLKTDPADMAVVTSWEKTALPIWVGVITSTDGWKLFGQAAPLRVRGSQPGACRAKRAAVN